MTSSTLDTWTYWRAAPGYPPQVTHTWAVPPPAVEILKAGAKWAAWSREEFRYVALAERSDSEVSYTSA